MKRLLLLGLLVMLLVGCGPGQDSVSGSLPEPETPSGWQPVGEAQRFERDTLYDLVNGQADSFFAYGFEQVIVRDYENDDGVGLRAAIWRLEMPADAYGLFTSYRAGTPLDIGNGADTDGQRRLDFWQDRYFVRLLARQPVAEAELSAFAEAISNSLPDGGEPPPLLDRLPQAGLVEQSLIFFHEPISVQNYLWLGAGNPLGLSPETNGLLARYDGPAQLLLIQYPDSQAATAGLSGLQNSEEISGLVAAEVKGNLLAALFGQGDPALIEAVLK